MTNNKAPFFDSVLFVIVLYNESLQDTITFKSLELATSESNNKLDLFVYDNSPSPISQKLIHNNFEVEYVSDKNNGGLSIAYNTGFKKAIEKGKKYVILLDQDTEFSDDFLSKYKKAITSNPTVDIFSPKLVLSNGKIFSPSIYKFKRGWHPSNVNVGINKLSKLVPVNSGVVISTNLFKKVGGYNENLKVDFIDFNFIERARLFVDDFYVIDTIGEQEFSDESSDLESVLHRYTIYLMDIYEVKKEVRLCKVFYIINVINRTLKLTVKFRTFKFIKKLLKIN